MASYMGSGLIFIHKKSPASCKILVRLPIQLLNTSQATTYYNEANRTTVNTQFETTCKFIITVTA